MALVVVLVGSVIISIIFNISFNQAWFASRERAGFIDHATMIHHVQTVRASIAQANIDNGSIMSNRQLRENWEDEHRNDPITNTTLTLGDLQVIHVGVPPGQDPFAAPIGVPIFNGTWNEDVADGAGRDRVEITVFDIFFRPGWINRGAMTTAQLMALPPSFIMEAGATADSFEDEGWATTPDLPVDPPDPPEPGLEPGSFGAYLIRVELFDSDNVVVRRVEEVFVQVLPPPPAAPAPPGP